MGIQKYRFDKVGKPDANGAMPLYTKWLGSETLAGIRNCPCAEYGPRTVYVTGDADSFFSIPAAIKVQSKTIKGFVSQSDGNWLFTVTKDDNWQP